MSADPSAAFQISVAAALLADLDIKSLVGEGVYDNPPTGAALPYITIGEDQIIDDGDGCAAGSEVHVNVYIWSSGPSGRLTCKTIAAVARDALNQDLVLDGHNVIDHTFESLHHVRDPDGIGCHSVLTIRYLTEPAA